MLNIPNILSIIRLCLAPLFVECYFSGLPHAGVWAIGIYALASFTDFLDGFIARKYNLITNLGRVLDPLGDKMMTFAVLACLCIDEILPSWVVCVFAGKELTMGIGGLLIHKKAKADIPSSNYVGKTATVLFFVCCAALVLFPQIPKNMAIVMISVVLAVAIAALVTYAVRYWHIMNDHKE